MFPFDKIKIDQSFVRGVTEIPESIAIIRAVTGLASALGMATTAEGIVTQEECEFVRAENCTEAQGYLIATPMPAHQVVDFLRHRHSTRTAA
jgi:EAL domain-containing protein (putative c-di-GMP-specific phosphodiesterase class I)